VRAVLDPNVLASAAISPAGPPRQILTAWTNERFELIISPGVLEGVRSSCDAFATKRRWDAKEDLRRPNRSLSVPPSWVSSSSGP
jgi:predicted nucleic acid-binding protein